VVGLTGEDFQWARVSNQPGAAAAATLVRPAARVRGRTEWAAVLFAAVFTAYGVFFGSAGVEERYSRVFKVDHVRPSVVADAIAECQIRFPMVPIIFCDTRKLAQEWT
jgi:hypothetical protein